MTNEPRRRYVAAPQPDAEPTCLLTKEGAERREVPPDALFAEVRSEEKECCPFFNFEQIEEGGEVVLRIVRAREATT